MINLNNIVEYIDLDNTNSVEVFHGLSNLLKASYREFPAEINLLAIFFIDFLKLITHFQLKSREINNRVNLTEFRNSQLQQYPYFGYSDLISGFNLEEKQYGKNTALGFSARKIFSKKDAYIKYIDLSKRLSKKRSKRILFTGESGLSSKKHIDTIVTHANLRTLNISHPWFFVPNFSDQVDFLSSHLESALSPSFESPQVLKRIIKVCLNHATASISNEDRSPNLNADFLILGSGYELENRMIASVAKRQNIPVVNVIHGEGYGIYDEPGFGIFGEHMFSDYLLGYGAGAILNKNQFSFEQNTNLKYIESNADTIIKSYDGPEVIQPPSRKINYYYFPTSYRGSQHRFGPFQDLPDALYIEWQNLLAKLFNDKLTMKLHPKEKYSFLSELIKIRKIKKSYAEIEDRVDVFIFDYIGTAFNQACATNKPVVYFDLGLRNISEHALSKIKKRTIYFDLRKEEVPTLTEIENRIFELEKINELTINYSLTKNRKSRSQSLMDALEV